MNNENTITCPLCRQIQPKLVNIKAKINHQIKEQIKAENQNEYVKQKEKMKRRNQLLETLVDLKFEIGNHYYYN